MAETKPKPASSLRTPKPKKMLGLIVPPALRLPHEDLITPKTESTEEGGGSTQSVTSRTSHTSPTLVLQQPSITNTDTDVSPETLNLQSVTHAAQDKSNQNRFEITSRTSLASQTSLTSQTRESSLLGVEKGFQATEFPVSPQRDFTKFANSINRVAVPSGLFTGKSKQLYDCLYSLTRGAITPARSVRISRPRLMKQSNIGSRVTFDANIERLVSAGLVTVRQIIGEHDGNEYTVFLPEEASFPETSMPSQTSMPSLTSPAQNLDTLVRLETSLTRHSLSLTDSEISTPPKTSFKTKEDHDDDEAFAHFTAAVRKTVVEITGREPSAAEAGRWEELAEVLMTELRIAAGRTTVSSVPAFLAEHLRRRLWKKEKLQIEAETVEQQSSQKSKIDAAKCPDCFGTGMYYPEGFEKGVGRCDHKRLMPEQEN